MATYTLNAGAGTFAYTGYAAAAKRAMAAAVGTFSINRLSPGFGVFARPAIGTRLVWRNSQGQYYVVVP